MIERSIGGRYLKRVKYISKEEEIKMKNLVKDWLKTNKIKRYSSGGTLINGTK